MFANGHWNEPLLLEVKDRTTISSSTTLPFDEPDYEAALLVVVDPSLTIRMNERNHTLGTLRQTLQRADPSLRLRPVYLQIDEVVPHGFLVKLMLVFKSAGFQQVGLVFEDKLVPMTEGKP